MTSLVFEASFAVGILSKFFSKALNAGRSKDVRVDTILLKDLTHGFAGYQLAVGHAFEFGGEGYPPGNDAGDKRTLTKLSDFFGIKLFFSHSAPFCLELYEHYYSRTYPLWGCPQYGVLQRQYCDTGMSTVWGFIKSALSIGWGCHLRMTVHDMGM